MEKTKLKLMKFNPLREIIFNTANNSTHLPEKNYKIYRIFSNDMCMALCVYV